MAGFLEGKRILVTGIITDSSIAFHIAKVAQEEGAELVLTGFDRMRLIQRIARPVAEAGAAARTRRAERGAPRHAGRPGHRGDRRGQQARRRRALDRLHAADRDGHQPVLRRAVRGRRQGHPHLGVLVRVAGQGAAADHEPRRRHRRHGLRPDPRDAGLQLDDGGQERAGVGQPVRGPRGRARSASARISLRQARSGRSR